MITILIGAPRSGKTTLVNNHFLTMPNTVVVCGDDIRKALTGDRFNEYSEQFVSAIKHTMIRALHNRGMNVIVDGTHSTTGSINKILEICPEAQIVFVPNKDFYLDGSNMYKLVDTAINTKQADLIPIIQRIFYQISQGVKCWDIEAMRENARIKQMKVIQD